MTVAYSAKLARNVKVLDVVSGTPVVQYMGDHGLIYEDPRVAQILRNAVKVEEMSFVETANSTSSKQERSAEHTLRNHRAQVSLSIL
jgi:hypothetical protein